jgi:hypothetical protein
MTFELIVASRSDARDGDARQQGKLRHNAALYASSFLLLLLAVTLAECAFWSC